VSKPANKTLIGAFIVGAVALVVAGLLVFGSGKFFAPMKKFVIVFEGSVKGLNVGSPVIFRGVKIGEVTEIRLLFNPKDLTAAIPVYVEIDPGTLAVPEEFEPLMKEADKKYVFIQPLIQKGLKAQLQMQSFVTGQLVINLDFFPDKPVKLVGLEKKYPEVPTVPAPMEELTKTLQDLKLDELFKKITLAVEGIERFVNSPELQGSVSSVNQTVKDIGSLAKNVDVQVGPLVSDMRSTADAARAALEKIETAFSMQDGVPAQVNETLKVARDALKQAEQTLLSVRGITEQNANIGSDLSRALRDLSGSARAIRDLAEYLERHPEALLRGKKTAGGD
jgi:paraquat-inducible protein B